MTMTTTAAFVDSGHYSHHHHHLAPKKQTAAQLILLHPQRTTTAKTTFPFFWATQTTTRTIPVTFLQQQHWRLYATSSDDSDSDKTTKGSSSSNNNNNNPKRTWHVFWDLECPFARNNWQQLPALREAFSNQFEFVIHLTSLAFHPAAWVGQCAAFLIRRELGQEAWHAFVDACYEQQHLYKDELKDARPSELAAVFADIAAGANLFSKTTTTTNNNNNDSSFTREYFLEHVRNWNEIIKPTYQEHKYALEQGVFGTPKHVIEGTLVPDTQSSWGVHEWQDKLQSMGFLD